MIKTLKSMKGNGEDEEKNYGGTSCFVYDFFTYGMYGGEHVG